MSKGKPLARRPMLLTVLAAFATVAAIGIVGAVHKPAFDRFEQAAPPAPVRFALVAYHATRFGALDSYVLDSGLTVSDCAYALRVAYAERRPANESLLTCEFESAVTIR